ncbi:pectate lyase [Pedobacter insulae]|uniref:Pectate lyase, PelA/Pel-15E family n=1 Tax=Pedobacter insulae TaxID=414048 RepID=A0A1I2ZYY5_9SPHI|nr:pectate lyase [Pedobacter insulae]SFH42875.1 pectate lyase, PelA/Pel-15E family [Pedobacter insulae]
MKNNITLLYTIISISFCSCATAQTANHGIVKTDSIAEKMLIYQLSNGAWPKQLTGGYVVKYETPIDEALMAKIKSTTYMHATIDNAATSREITALVQAYKTTNNKNYLLAAQKGIDYLLKAQYENGGWPQYYPDKSSYRAEITYNDNAMVNVLNIMFNIANQTKDFEVVDQSYHARAENAYQRGLDCILKTQIVQSGRLSIWAAQYDQNTLKPAKARSFEPASLSTAESVAIVRFLMRIKNPSPQIKNAINSAIAWFNSTKIVGYRFDKLPDIKDKGLIKDDTSVIWARFYDFETNQPIFGDRDNSIKSNVAEISYERRNGYAWYGNFAAKLLATEYPKWQKNNP